MPRAVRRQLLAAVTVVTAVGLVACGSSTPLTGQQAAAALPTASPPHTVAAVPTIPIAYRGTWTAVVNGTSASSGSWTMRITEHDIELKNPIATSDADFFSIHPDDATDATVHFATDPDCDQADYAWSIVKAQLVLTTAADPCTDRVATLATSPWTRQP